MLTINNTFYGMDFPALTAIRKNLTDDKIHLFLQSKPTTIKIVDQEKEHERLGKCAYVAMTDIIGITHEPAPFKTLELRDWYENLKLIQYFDLTNQPKKGDLAVYYPDDTTEIRPLHFAKVIHFDVARNMPIVRSKWGSRLEIFEHELYTVPLVYENSAKFFTLKPQYVQEGKKTILLAAIQHSINQSQLIKKELPLLENLLSKLASGNSIVIRDAAEFNELDSIKDKIWFVLKGYPGLNINAYNRSHHTPLMTAAIQGHYEITELLVNFGAEVNKQNKNGNTALIFASQNKHDKIVSFLIQCAGADPEIKNYYGEKAIISSNIQKAIEAKQNILLQITAEKPTDFNAAYFLLSSKEKGININAQTPDTLLTPLMIATSNGNFEMVQLFITYGADTTIKNKDGKTAFNIAQDLKHDAIIQLLQEQKI